MEGRLQALYPSFKLPRRGHFFAARSAKKRRNLSRCLLLCLLRLLQREKVRGEKVDEHSELGREMPARRPQDPKGGSRGISVVVEHGDEYAVAKLPAYGEVGQTSNTHAFFGHGD